MWRAIRKELDDIGISVAAFDANKDFIMEWFRAAISSGAFDEKARNDDMDPTLSRFDSAQPGIDSGTFSLETRSITAHTPSTATPLKQHPSPNISPSLPKPLLVPNLKLGARDSKILLAVSLVAQVTAWALRYHTSFLSACEIRDLSTAEKLLNRGADIEGVDKKGQTALSAATIRNDIETMEWLLMYGAKPWGPELHLVVATGGADQVTAAKLLLHHGADIEFTDAKNDTPLVVACELRNTKMVDFLLNKGASVNAMGLSGCTALYTAVKKGNLSVAEVLVAHGAKLDIPQNKNGDFALLRALREGFDDIAHFLIENGDNIHVKERRPSESTVLHLAAERSCHRSIKLLLEKDMDVNQQNYLQFTPLDYAVTLKEPTTAKLLLDNGAINNSASRSYYLPPEMVGGYKRFKALLRNYPHGASNPQLLYTGS